MLIEPHWRFGPEFGEKELEKPHFTFHSTLLRMAAHAFSHCDAPFHVSPDMETIDEMGLDRFFGPARMVDVSGHGDRAALGEKELREGGAAALQPGEIALIRSDHELRHPTTTPSTGLIRRGSLPGKLASSWTAESRQWDSTSPRTGEFARTTTLISCRALTRSRTGPVTPSS
ncbi:cyclase family protein [Propionibacterium freudenreichii]|uniref:cyclase family protein n=1 Tax=Propionibacterium freudenreichii TaxID=1744 RepID=UPI003A4C668E|nr:cyclase family protein [Propionibacterium freudenreichii]